jgi:Flp pilus assembly CpaE family ATPase
MATVLIIDDDVNLLRMLQIMLERGGFQTILASHGEDGIRKAVEQQPDMAIVDVMMPDLSGHDVCRRLREDARTARIPLLVLTARAQPVDRQAALSSGASDYLSKPVSPKVLLEKVRDLISQPPGPPRAGHLITVLSLRGGTGATSVAVNLGVQLAAARRGAVCVADFSPASGHVALQLRVQARQSWLSYRPDPGGPNGDAVRRHAVGHELGLHILPAPLMPIQGPGLSSAVATALLADLRKAFAWIVVDAAPLLDDATVAALGASDAVVVVMTPEVASVQTTTATLRTISALGPAAERPFVVLNQVSPQRALPQSALEKHLGRPVAANIPFDEGQLAALSQGTPLSASQPTAPLARAVAELTQALLDQVKTPARAAV